MKQALYLSQPGLICSTGVGIEAMLTAMTDSQNVYLTKDTDLINDKAVYVGQVTQALPEIQDLFHNACEYNSRNNRLLLHALDQIQQDIDVLINQYERSRIGVVIGTSTTGVDEAHAAYEYYLSHNEWPKEFYYKQQKFSNPSEFLSKHLNLTGPSYTVSTACSSSGKTFASAQNLINADLCDAVIVGGVDSLCALTLNGFNALESLASQLAKPFCESRDGINIGEGAALFILSKQVSEVQLLGVGESSDCHHISAPDPEAKGAIKAMKMAVEASGIELNQVDYINLHGTATIQNDLVESLAVNQLFGDQVLCSSTKRLTGHTLGAAGAIEAAISWLCLSSYNHLNQLPVMQYTDGLGVGLSKLNYVEEAAMNHTGGINTILSNSFAFGGSNVSVLLSKAS